MTWNFSMGLWQVFPLSLVSFVPQLAPYPASNKVLYCPRELKCMRMVVGCKRSKIKQQKHKVKAYLYVQMSSRYKKSFRNGV
uniref:Secreted protein n=1 Tax=Anguilla anguilla TaxID=7936 RepID=A0A0E9QAW9_ANGAN